MWRFIGNRFFAIGMLVCVSISPAFSQNLVLNPSFESVNTANLQCSWYVTQAGFNSAVNNWTCPTGGSTDIFHSSLATSCFCSPWSTNAAGVGQQTPRTGNSETAIFVYGNGGCSPYREYIQGSLSSPLVAGQTYVVEMYVSLGDYSINGANNIGVKFSTAPVNVSSMCVYSATPDVNYTGVILDKTNWTQISLCFTPSTSGLQYFMIGNFFNDAATTAQASGSGSMAQTRYYIDDVRVELATNTTPGSAGANGTVNICPGDGPFNMFDYLGGTPSSGGTWSGPSILTGGSMGTFYPTTSAIGTYTYTISSSSGCGAVGGNATAQVTVALNGAANAVINQPANVCVNASSVQLTAASSNGTWTSSCGSCISASGLFNPASAGVGSHTVTYSIGSPCPGSDTKTIVVEAVPVVNAGNDVAICANSSTVLTASGATSYTWSPTGSLSASSGASVTATPTTTTTYTLTGTTGNCSSQDNVIVTVNPLPVINTSTNATICLNDTTTLSASGASTYSWSPAAGLSNASAGTTNSYPATSTTYTVTGTDLNGCTAQGSVSVTVNPLPAVNAGADVAICFSDTTSLTASGANSYVWTPSQGLSASAGATINAYPQNTTTYTVLGTDNNGCENTDAVTVTVNSLPTVVASADVDICENDTTLLTATGAGSYTWSPSVSLSSATGNSVQAFPLSTTVFAVTGTDNNGCESADSVTITVNTLPVLSLSPDLSICVGDTTTISASGADSYVWSPGQSLTDSLASSTSAYPQVTTTYLVEGTDLVGCASQASLTITVNSLPPVDAGNNVAICLNDATLLNASGAVNYVWSPNQDLSTTVGSSVSASPQNSITYTVTGTDNNGCVQADTVHVQVNPLPPVLASADVSVCLNTSTALSVAGANTYVWTPSASLSDSLGATVTATPTSTTQYTVTGTDNNGCQNTDNVTVTVFSLPVISLSPAVSICAGDATQLTANGAATYAWSPITGLTPQNPQNSVVSSSPVNSTTYTVTGTDANGCVNSNQVLVTVLPNPLPSFVLFPPTGCSPLAVNFSYTGTPVSTYNWNFGNSTQGTGNSPSTVYGQPGVYSVSLSVSDPFGCTATVSQQNAVSVYPYPVAGFTANPQQMWEDNALVNVGDGSQNASTWQYVVSDGSAYTSPSFTHTFTDTGHYYIMQIVGSNVGCMDTAYAEVTVKPVSSVYIPNAFTPGNDDPFNGTFKVFGNGLDEFQLLIFDRWGELIFSSKDQNVGWDGTLRGKLCKQDVYVYKVSFLNHLKEQKTVLGSVTLLR